MRQIILFSALLVLTITFSAMGVTCTSGLAGKCCRVDNSNTTVNNGRCVADNLANPGGTYTCKPDLSCQPRVDLKTEKLKIKLPMCCVRSTATQFVKVYGNNGITANLDVDAECANEARSVTPYCGVPKYHIGSFLSPEVSVCKLVRCTLSQRSFSKSGMSP